MFSTRKKICFVIGTLFLLIIAGFRSINPRLLLIVPEAHELAGEGKIFHSREVKEYYWNQVYKNAKGIDRVFLETNVAALEIKDEGENYKKLYEADPDNVLYCSNYAIYLSRAETEETLKRFRTVADHWKKLDPENALPCFLIALKELEKGIKWVEQENQFVYQISDNKAVERGLQEYYAGLQKKYASSYIFRAIQKKRALANLKPDPLGEMQRISIDISCLQFLLPNSERMLTDRLAFLAEKFSADGKKKESLELLRSGKKYLQLRLEEENQPFISILVFYAISKRWDNAAQKTGFSADVPYFSKITSFHQNWKTRPVPGADLLERYGGFYIQELAPAFRKEVTKEELKPERMITYLVADGFGMAALYIQMLCLIFMLALISLIFYLRKRAPRWIELPQKSYLKLLVIGIILPVAVFLLWTHFDVLSGRDLNIAHNRMLFSLTAKYLVFFMPLFFGILACVELVKKEKAKPVDCIWNLIFLFAMFLCVTSLILRPALDLKIRHYTKQDTLIHTEKAYCGLENRTVEEHVLQIKKFPGDEK